jgi:DNA repair exonuclease SbcCD ATPase subunit
VSAGIVSDTQSMVNTIIGMDMRTFTQSVLLSYGNRSFVEMTDKEQKDVLEDILQIDVFTRARELLRQRLAGAQTKLAGVLTTFAAKTAEEKQLTLQVSKLTQQHTQHAAQQQHRRLELLKRKAVTEAEIDILSDDTRLDRLLDELRTLDEEAKAFRDAEQEASKYILETTRVVAQKRSAIEQQAAVARHERTRLVNDQQRMDGLVGKPCPTCRQNVDTEFVDALMELADVQARLLDDKLVAYTKDLEKLRTSEAKVVAEHQQKQADARASLADVQPRQRIIYDKIKKREAALQSIWRLEAQVSGLVSELGQIALETNPFAELVQEAEKQLVLTCQEVRHLQFQKQSLEMETKHLLFWDHGFGNQGLKSYVLDSVIPFLSERAQHYADIMSGGDLNIEFSTQTQLKTGEWREQFQVNVTNAQGSDIYKGNSAGEKRRSDIAVGWALGDLAAARAKKPIRFKGLDEPTESLDESGQDAVIKLLHAVISQYETILCISHSSSLRNQLPQEITVVKENGQSRVT